MAYLAGNGIRYPSSFDPIIDRLLRVDVRDGAALSAGLAAVRRMLAEREREELPTADGVRFARRRISGSIRDLGLARSKAPPELHAVLDELTVLAQRAHDAAPDFDRPAPPPDPPPLADWVPAELGGPVSAPPPAELAVVEIDLEDE